ncbi:MAG: tetratricopeptide repeat protein [Vicinamibacterales bacterium]
MSRDSLIFAASGTFFGLLLGWILGTQAPRSGGGAVPVQTTAAVPAPGAPVAPGAQPAPKPLDMQRATALERQANQEPQNVTVRVQLGNLYYDADRFDLAIPWYQAALQLDPKDVNVSTDLAVCYYSTNQVDQALAQLDHSLSVDPNHLQTLLNQGIIRAFGKQDLAGAAQSWEKVVQISPQSEEGRRAQQGLDGIKSAHGGGVPGAAGGTGSAGGL